MALITLLWALHPLLFSRARGIVILMAFTGVLALAGWLASIQPLVVWSGGLGLLNLTLSLVLTSHPPNLWVGLSAGITLLALLDGSQRFAYLRHCQLEPGVLPPMLGMFLRISGLSLAASVAMALLVMNLANQGSAASAAGLMSVAGAGLFVALVALLLLYTSRWAEQE
ncbi:MAG: hypothetical protein HYZ81_05640 [Nitrospinae bacterium]|nr:hypothetical protein [Nitrospinota bacterium]